MKFQLGAMSVGEILDRSLQILVRRLPTFYVLALIVLGPQFLLECAGPYILPEGSLGGVQGYSSGMEEVMGTALMELVGSLVTCALLPVGIAASVHIIAREYAGEQSTLRSALRSTMPHFVSLLATTIMTGLLVGVVAFATCCPLACLAGFILAAVSPAGPGGQPAADPELQQAIVLPIVLLSTLPPLFVVSMYGLFGPAVVMEEKPALEAMSRSKELGEGFFLRTLGVMFLLLVVWVGFRAVTQFPFQFFLLPFEPIDDSGGVIYHPLYYFLNKGITILLEVFPVSFMMIVITLLYFDLRIRKEGFDLELAALQTAGGGIADLTGQDDEEEYERERERPRRRAKRLEDDEERPRRRASPWDLDQPRRREPPPPREPEPPPPADEPPPLLRFEAREVPPEPDEK